MFMKTLRKKMPPAGVPEPVPLTCTDNICPADGILHIGKKWDIYIDTQLTLEQYLFGKVGI